MTVTIHIGASGMGKTYAGARIVEKHADAGWTCICVDQKHEWSIQSKRGVLVSGPTGATAAADRGERIIVWSNSVEPDLESICQWILKRGRGTLLFLPEAHLPLPLGPRPPTSVVKVLTGYRHAGLAIILDTQRIVSLSMMARNNAGLVRVFGVIGRRDLDELEEWGGRGLAEAAREAATRRARDDKQRGWFVAFDPANPQPSYQLQRL